MKNFLSLALAIVACEAIGFFSAWISFNSFPLFYAALVKPTFAPPPWLFGPVWTVLYALMGIAAYLIYRDTKKKKYHKAAWSLFGIQLLLNFLWSPIFFGWGQLFFALIEIIILLYFILLTIFAFLKVNKTAAYLLIPYFVWVAFASILTASIWLLNK